MTHGPNLSNYPGLPSLVVAAIQPVHLPIRWLMFPFFCSWRFRPNWLFLDLFPAFCGCCDSPMMCRPNTYPDPQPKRAFAWFVAPWFNLLSLFSLFALRSVQLLSTGCSFLVAFYSRQWCGIPAVGNIEKRRSRQDGEQGARIIGWGGAWPCDLVPNTEACLFPSAGTQRASGWFVPNVTIVSYNS